MFPVYQYTHDNGGCSVVGGYVYRGKAAASEKGRYISATTAAVRITTLRMAGGNATAVRLEPFTLPNLSSFGEDARPSHCRPPCAGVVIAPLQ